MFDLLRFVVGAVLWFGICLWALARGGPPERIVSAGKLIGSLLTPLVQYNVGDSHAELGVLAVDAILVAVIVWAALRWDRWWVLFAAAFGLCQVLTHVARMAAPQAAQFYYATAAIFWSYLGLWALAFGMIQIEARRWRDRGMARR